jgi:hypothetical protein
MNTTPGNLIEDIGEAAVGLQMRIGFLRRLVRENPETGKSLRDQCGEILERKWPTMKERQGAETILRVIGKNGDGPISSAKLPLAESVEDDPEMDAEHAARKRESGALRFKDVERLTLDRTAEVMKELLMRGWTKKGISDRMGMSDGMGHHWAYGTVRGPIQLLELLKEKPPQKKRRAE